MRQELRAIRFIPEFQLRAGETGWQTPVFAGKLPAAWSALLDPRLEALADRSASGGRWRFTIGSLLVAVAVTAVVFAGGLWFLGHTPCPEMPTVAIHARFALNWEEYTQLSEKGISSIVRNSFGLNVLEFNHYVQPRRLTERIAAEEFDRSGAKISAIFAALRPSTTPG